MKNKIFVIFLWIMTFVFLILVFYLPEIIPIHWGMDGQADQYGSRYFALLFVVLPVIVNYGMILTKKIDPNQNKIKIRSETYELMRKLISLMFICMGIFFYYMLFIEDAYIQNGICFILGVFLIAIGNYMPKVPQNYFLGVKTPWSLKDEIVWKKTNKIGGYCIIGLGILIIIAGWMKKEGMYLIIAGCIAVVVIPYVYSYIIYDKKESK